MKEKIKFSDLKGYILPVLLGVGTIVSGIMEKKNQDRNAELDRKLDALNKKLDDKGDQ